MAKTRFEFDIKGFEEIRRSPAAVERLQEEVDRILAIVNGTGGGYAGEVHQGQGRGTLGRAIGTVWTTDFQAILDNSRNHTLLRALAGGSMVLYTSKAGKTSLVTQKQANNYSSNKKAR